MISCRLIIPTDLYQVLQRHLFPGDADEHGAVISAGCVETPTGIRLLAREVHVARDGVDYVPGRRGYRMLTGAFITERIIRARDERLIYLAVHNHGGQGSVAFSPDDLRSHERGYPSLLDIGRGIAVGALVFAEDAVAGDIWLSHTRRVPLTSARVIGPTWRSLFPAQPPRPDGIDPRYQRQSLMFGEPGQALLRELKVGIVGAGGVGSVLIELLARLGVGHLVVVDPDFVDLTNLPRLVGARSWDAMAALTRPGRPEWLRRIGTRFATRKVKLAERIARRANPSIRFEAIDGDFLRDPVPRAFIDCDFLFLAADPMPVRHLFNALAHQYSIPAVQVGSKVRVAKETGDVVEAYSAARPLGAGRGCLTCNGFIPADKLQADALSAKERRRQRYVDDPDIEAPSVIALNALGASVAANDFLFTTTGLTLPSAPMDYVRFRPRERNITFEQPRSDEWCGECAGRRARGDLGPRLPTKPAR